ncbi:hypothetical protein [Ruegeria aquimaris]|uniref:Uncharacterized protein n=1 Tax=Ruegeria aquimaris TaxID=2984333 RepID=A0ABT3AGD3_9RHOB|nr:hypothetical protein [Ruegeria sp. XHP0148]MCV2887736.1 hypothetical protein [Ruegeria sp. XHP0148]
MFDTRQWIAALAATCLFTTASRADEEAEKMVQDALDVMYHTCQSVIDEADGDEAYVLDVVSKMVALSLYNREIDITAYSTSEEDKTRLREAFIAALGEGCQSDQNALLGGVVDTAVKTTLGL